MADPGIGVGPGGMIMSLFNPGLASSVAQHITPNPNPLAQQGQPGAGTVDSLGNPTQPNLAQPAVTQPDPANAANVAKLATPPDSSYAADLMRYQRLNRQADYFNRGMGEVAAGFGTAQQQASKQAALRGGDGSVGGGLGDLAGIQKMQDQTIQDNEHARFMGNAQVFADSLSQALGRKVSIQEAQMYQNDPSLMKDIASTMTGNQATTDAQKNVNADMESWIKANPTASPQEIAQHKSDLMEQTVGGLSMIGKELREDRKNYMAVHPHATMAEMIADRPDLADETSYVAIKGEQAKTQAAAGVDRLNAKNSFASVNPQWDQLETNINWLAAPEHRQAVLAALAQSEYATTGQSGRFANWLGYTGKDVLDAKRLLDQVRNEGFTSEFKNTKNIRSNTEANRIGASFSSLFSPTITPDGAQAELDRLTGMVKDGRANIYAAAGQKIPSRFLDANIDPDYLDSKSLLHNGATFENDFSKMSQEQADAAVHALSPGDMFIGTDGRPHKRN